MTKTRLPQRACKGCGRPVYFVKDDKGTVHVLDARAPVYVQVRDTEDGSQQVMKVQGYVSHCSTCPKESEFSRAKQQSLPSAAEGERSEKISRREGSHGHDEA